MMRSVFTAALLLATMGLLAACPGYMKGHDAGVGLSAMDTQSKESEENEKWFDSFYGKSKCTTVWGTSCEEESSGGGGGGGMWSGGVGPSDTSAGN